jgi:hypothetical protein
VLPPAEILRDDGDDKNPESRLPDQAQLQRVRREVQILDLRDSPGSPHRVSVGNLQNLFGRARPLRLPTGTQQSVSQRRSRLVFGAGARQSPHKEDFDFAAVHQRVGLSQAVLAPQGCHHDHTKVLEGIHSEAEVQEDEGGVHAVASADQS